MTIRRLLLSALIAALAPVLSRALAVEPLRPPIPYRELELVLPRAVLGGREVSTARFTVAGDASRAADAIASAWRAAGARDVVRRDSGPWQIVSRIAGESVETAQLRDAAGGTSTGMISRWDAQPRPVKVTHHPRRLLPDDAALLDQVVSRDDARVAVTTVALVARGVAALSTEIGARARALGFVREPVVEAGTGGELDIAFYRKASRGDRAKANPGGAELVVTLERRGDRTAAVLHLVEEEAR